jgi:hypothetical protein
MLPMIAIGLGGTGKWVLTDLKKNLVEVYGKVPEKIALLEFDLLEQENIPVERGKFDLEQGKMVPFKLDYDISHNEFFNFCGELTKVVTSIKDGTGDYPFIEKWFGKDEAKGYSGGQLQSCTGAGQIRSLSRTSFFLKPDDIYKRISDNVRNIASKKEEKEIIPVFIISSVAGGTGCGTFIDFANIVHKCFGDLRRTDVQYYLFGIFVLPRGFEGTIPSSQLQARFKANCFSSFRELHRFYSTSGQNIQYTSKTGVKKDFPLFSITYFIDGKGLVEKNGAPTPHYLGLCPAISEFIMTYVEGTAPIGDLPKVVIAGTQPYFAPTNPQFGELNIPVYSTFGIHRYVLESEDIRIDFAHRLGKEILNYFIKQPVFAADAKVQEFMKGETATPLLTNFLYQTIENQGFVGTDKKSLINYIKFNSREEDIDVPEMRIDDIQIRRGLKTIPLEVVEGQVKKRKEKVIGSENDMASPDTSGGVRSTHGVMNYYSKKHEEKFANALEKYLIQILNDRDRKGSLLKAQSFLEALIKTFDNITERVIKMFDDLRIEDSINAVQKQISNCKNNKKYLELSERATNLSQQKIIMDSIIKIVKRDKEICDRILEDVKNWIDTFNAGITQINTSNLEHIKTRNSKRTIKCLTFVTDPNDKIENRIYELMKGDNYRDNIEKEIQEKIPRIRIEELVDSNVYFIWKFESLKNKADNSQIHLSCLLPEGFPPLESLKDDPIKWNYKFINKILGQLDKLNSFTIMDALQLKGEDPAGIAADLKSKSSLLADVDPNAQVRGVDEASNTEHFVKTAAAFTTTQPGSDFAGKLKTEIEKEAGNVVDDRQSEAFRYTILQLRIDNYIKYSGFTGLTDTVDEYRKVAIKGTYHVFPEEINALKIESKFEKVLHEKPNFLNCRVVNLLGDVEFVRSFVYSLMKKWITYDVVGTKKYNIELEDTTGEKRVLPLGESRIEALEFLLKENEDSNSAREKIKRQMEQFREEIKKNIEGVIKELKEFYTSIDLSKESNSAEKDLLKVVKIIIYNEFTELESSKNK